MPLSDISTLDRPRPVPGTVGQEREPGERREPPAEDEDKAQFLPVRTLLLQYTDYLTTKVDEIEEQKESRRYYHGAFYTAEQLRVLRDRHQPPIPWNRVAKKINRRVGLIQRLRSDPKAFGRNPKSEQGAEIATQSIRTVLDANEFKSIDWWCLLQSSIDGVSGVQLVLTRGDVADIDVKVDWVIADEYFYDAKSYRFDFKDSRYEGISKWFDIDEAIELFPEQEELLRSLVDSGSDLTTNPDREIKWTTTNAKRIRIVEHWYMHRGKWCWAFYCCETLLDQGVSPFIDEKGKPASSFYMFSRAVDHDGDRYGDVRNMKGPQDALNAGKSKTLHLANTKLIKATKQAVDDVETARREITRPDGWVEINPGGTFEIVDTKADLAAFVQFTEDAKQELDQDAGETLGNLQGSAIANISGRAIELLRQPGMAEMGPFILSYRAWKLRLYRGIWNAVQRHWTKERWLRVSDDSGLAQFIQLNGLDLDQFGRPAIVNALGSLDVNISLEEGPDVASLMQDTFDALKGYPPGTFPPQVLIEINPNIPRSDKKRILEMMAPKPPQQTPEQQIVKHLQLESAAGKNAKVAAETRKIHAGADELLAKAATEGVRPAHMAHSAEIDAAEFARDTLLEAHRISQPQPQPQSGQPPQGQPGMPPGAIPQRQPPAQFPRPF
jgi:hypothetical protein